MPELRESRRVQAKKRIAILQSNYIPWKGYFDIIRSVDSFVIYDIAQFTRNDWRNRNMIKTAQGMQWLTIPVEQSIHKAINETRVVNDQWRVKHWRSILQHYSRAEFFAGYRDRFQHLYLDCAHTMLSEINYQLLKTICDVLEIRTEFLQASDYEISGCRTGKLVNLCQQLQATDYVSGPRARDYIDESLFDEAGIAIHWADYQGYPEYEQFHPPFVHEVSILDLIFHQGPEARRFMKDVVPAVTTGR